MSDAPLDPQTLLQQSRTMGGALGAVAFTVLKTLQLGGADAKTVSNIMVLLEDHMRQLTDAQCNALCDTLHARLKEEAQKNPRWY